MLGGVAAATGPGAESGKDRWGLHEEADHAVGVLGRPGPPPAGADTQSPDSGYGYAVSPCASLARPCGNSGTLHVEPKLGSPR